MWNNMLLPAALRCESALSLFCVSTQRQMSANRICKAGPRGQPGWPKDVPGRPHEVEITTNLMYFDIEINCRLALRSVLPQRSAVALASSPATTTTITTTTAAAAAATTTTIIINIDNNNNNSSGRLEGDVEDLDADLVAEAVLIICIYIYIYTHT